MNKKIDRILGSKYLVIHLIVGIIFVAYTLASVYITNVTIMEGIKYIIYQILGVYCMGVVVTLLLDIQVKTRLQFLAVSYAVGYAIQILNWYISMATYGGKVQRELYVIELIVLVFCYVRKKKKYSFECQDISYSTILILAFGIITFIGVRFFTILGCNILPHGNIVNNYHIHDDLMWEIIQTVATKSSFPVDDLRWIGDKLYYHYWGYACNSVMSNVTGISCAKIITSLSFINEGVFFIVSTLAFLQYITKKQLIWCYGSVLLVFSSGIEWYSVVTWSGHITTIPLCVDIGICYMILSVGILLFSYKNSEIVNWKYVVIFVVFFAMATGTKGPCALTALVPILILCASRLLKDRKWSIQYSIAAVCAFGLVYVFVDSGVFDSTYINQYGGNTQMISQFLAPLIKYPVSDILQVTCDYPEMLSKTFLLIKYLYYSNPAIFIVTCVLLIASGAKNVTLDSLDLFMFIGYLSGYCFACIVNQDGCSEMYFTFSALPFGVGGIAALLDKIDIRRIGKFSMAIILLVSTMGVVCFYGTTKPAFLKGWHTILHNDSAECSIREIRTYRRNIYDACDWLRNNSSYNDVIISNSIIDDVIAGFDVTALSERRQWLEYAKYTRNHKEELERKREKLIDYYENGSEDFIDEIYNEGVRYFMNIKNIQYNMDLHNDNRLKVVFENEEVQIGCIESK